jgi:predicted alpha/beta superfamily hydrolase
LPESSNPSALGDVEVRDVHSDVVGGPFRLFVATCGAAPRSTLVVTDANGLLGLTVDTVRLMQLPALVPPLLVVGVGYPDARTIGDTVDLRTRDLTPTPSSRFPGSGRAAAFLRFLREDVLALVERAHPGAVDDTIYFGHSLGGLLGVHDLVSDDPVFDHHIVSSPSLWWDHHRVVDDVRSAHPHPGQRQRDAFFGIGGDETDAGRRREAADLPVGHPSRPGRTHLDMVDDMARFVELLRGRVDLRLRLDARVFPGEYHATVAPVTLTHGLRHVFEQP